MSISIRLKELRKKHLNGISQDKFADKIGTTGAAISRYESGGRAIPNTIILAICREFNVNEAWLREGKGEPFNETQQPTDFDILQEMVSNAGANEMILAIMRCWVRLDQRQREALNDFIDQVVAEYRSFGSFMTGSTMPIIEGSHDNAVYAKYYAKKEVSEIKTVDIPE